MANRPRRAKTYISNLRCSQAQRKKPTTLNRRNMTIAISRQVSEFKSDTIQTTSENCALTTKRLFFNYFCNSSKLSSALSAPPLTLAMLESENRGITQKEGKKKKSARACSTPGRTCLLSYNEVNRDDTVIPPSNHLVNNLRVFDSLSMSLLPCSSPPCQPPLPTTAAQLRCGHCARPP